MAILNQKRILNLIPKVSAPVTIHVSQGDVGTEIEFTLVKGDEVFVNPGNVSASVHGVREDGANFGAFTCTLSGSKVTFPLHSEMTAVKGSAIAEVVLVDDDGNKVGSANFGILVEESVFPLGVTYDNDVSVYESILAYVQTIPAQVTADYDAKINAETAARQAADGLLNSALANETSERTSADTTINARIDEIIAPSGEAPSAAEVSDARIGADAKTYASLGTAIRTQIGELNSAINEANNFGISWTQGAYIRNGTGAVWSATDVWSYTDFIGVSPKTTLVVKTEISGNASITLYTRRKGYKISYANTGNRELKQYIIPIPEDVFYVRFSCYTESIGYFEVYTQDGELDSDIQSRVTATEKEFIALLGLEIDYGNLQEGILIDGVPDLTDTYNLISTDFIPYSEKYIAINHDYRSANHLIGSVIFYDENYNYIPINYSVNMLNSDKPFIFASVKPLHPAYFKLQIRWSYTTTISEEKDIALTKEKIKIYDTVDTMFDAVQTSATEKFNSFDGDFFYPQMESGTYSSSTGEPEVNSKRLRTKDFIPYNPYDVIVNTYVSESHYLEISFKLYDENYDFYQSIGFNALDKFKSMNELYSFNPAYIKYVIKYSDSDSMDDGISLNNISRAISVVHTNNGLCNYLIKDSDHDISIDDLSDVMTNGQITSSFTKYISRKDDDFDNIIFSCEAKYVNSEGYNGIPTIQFGYEYASGIAKNGTITYVLGAENEYQIKQWRVVRPPHQNDRLIIRVTIPTGCTVSIRKFSGKRDNRIDRNADFIRFDGHQRIYSMPLDLKISAEMNAIAGYHSMIQIPKRLSDGVWIFYHDDTLVYNNTYIRELDGTPISSEYDGVEWSTVSSSKAFSWDWGIGQNAYYAGAKPMLMEEFFLLCAKTGMKPMLSVHPAPSDAEFLEIKEIAQKAGVLNKLGIIGSYNLISRAWSIFGNSIDTYLIVVPNGERTSADITSAIQVMDLMTGCTTRQVIELFASTAYEAYFGANQFDPYGMIREAGYICALAQQNGITKPISRVTTLYENGSDLEYWIKEHGVTEFCHEAQYSSGLNW